MQFLSFLFGLKVFIRKLTKKEMLTFVTKCNYFVMTGIFSVTNGCSFYSCKYKIEESLNLC